MFGDPVSQMCTYIINGICNDLRRVVLPMFSFGLCSYSLVVGVEYVSRVPAFIY